MVLNKFKFNMVLLSLVLLGTTTPLHLPAQQSQQSQQKPQQQKAKPKEETSLFSWGTVDKVKGWVIETAEEWGLLEKKKVQVKKTPAIRREVANTQAQAPVTTAPVVGAPKASSPILADQTPKQTNSPTPPTASSVQARPAVDPVVPKLATPTDFSAQDVKTELSRVKKEKAIVIEGGRKAVLNNGLELNKKGIPSLSLTKEVKEAPAKKGAKPKVKIVKIETIPKLDIGQEPLIRAQDFKVSDLQMQALKENLSLKLKSPEPVTAKDVLKATKLNVVKISGPKEFNNTNLVTQKEIEEMKTQLNNLSFSRHLISQVALKDYSPLTRDEIDLLSALLLYKKGDECASAIPLFHRLAEIPKYKAESLFHLAACSKKLNYLSDLHQDAIDLIKTKDAEFVPEVVALIGTDVVHDFKESYGKALLSIAEDNNIGLMKNKKTAEAVALNIAYYGVLSSKYQIGRDYAKKVSEKNEKAYQARYLEAVAEYALSQGKGTGAQTKLLTALEATKNDPEFYSLAAVNLARLYFQNNQFDEAAKYFKKVDKSHPLWLSSLPELGWAQVQSGDYAGAIGNMYSVHSPFFDLVYKPESYVIKTIGYLKLCQYGDAYRSLTTLEKQYRPWVEQISGYLTRNKMAKEYYKTVKTYVRGNPKESADGLPPQVIREMARNKDFLNLQKSLNRLLDEEGQYGQLGTHIEKNIQRSKGMIANAKSSIQKYRTEEGSIGKNPKARQAVQVQADISREMRLVESLEFILGVHDRTKQLLTQFVNDGAKEAKKRTFQTKANIELTLAKRLMRMKRDLDLMLENNELLRYEVFSGSGENIRQEVAGGEKAAKRVPASAVPQSKDLKWSFDGEYWADEIGHYRSSLKSNCPRE